MTADVMPTIGFDHLAEHLQYELIEQALAAHGVASIRRHHLPAEQVVWLVIALALFRRQSMAEVLSTLDLALPAHLMRMRQLLQLSIVEKRQGRKCPVSSKPNLIAIPLGT